MLSLSALLLVGLKAFHSNGTVHSATAGEPATAMHKDPQQVIDAAQSDADRIAGRRHR
jgi:hypothetical protein